MAPSSLLDLPPEVLLRVVEYASPLALKVLRLSCSALQKMSDPTLFHTVAIYPHMYRLEQILNISLQPRLRQHVKALHYDSRYISLVDHIIKKIESTYSTHVTPEEKSNMISEARKFKKFSLNPGRDDDIELLFLHDILRNLSSVESVSCTESRNTPWGNAVFVVDDLPDIYNNLRKMTCARHSDFDLEPGFHSSSQQKQTAARLLVASGRAPPGKITSFTVAYGLWESIINFEPGGKHISMLSAFLGGLRTLKVSAELNDFHRSHEPLLSNLAAVLDLAVSLQTLHLGFGMGNSNPFNFLERGHGQPQPPSSIQYIMRYDNVGGTPWPKRLLSLSLANMICYKPEFLELMQQCQPRLKHLALADFAILPVLDVSLPNRPRPECLVETMRDVKRLLSLESTEFLGEFNNGRAQVLSFMSCDSPTSMKSQVEHYMTKNGGQHPHPLDALAIQPGQIDVTEEQLRRNKHLNDLSFKASGVFLELKTYHPFSHLWADNTDNTSSSSSSSSSSLLADEENDHE